jgi:hypothetical protein
VATPDKQSQRVFVDREGQIVEGSQARAGQPLSEVRQDKFATRLDNDRATVATFLPNNAREFVTEEGIVGWVYEFSCEFGTRYSMFAYYDGANYQVHVISPQLESHWKSAHTGHIFPDGRICFGSDYGQGQPTLREAFAKSVLWATGISAARFGHTPFPFSANNRTDAA